MATVTGYTKAFMDTIVDATVTGAHIDGSGHLILELHDGSTVDAGYMLASLPDASDTVKGKVELATNAETVTGTDTVRATTPAGVAAAIAAIPAVPQATTTTQGKVELATTAETQTGTDTDRAVTPAALKGSREYLGMTGEVKLWPVNVIPSGWLLCDGSFVSRTTYADLYDTLVPVLGTCTITIASPGVVTLNNHGLIAGDVVCFTTTGALPTGLATTTHYFVLSAGLTTNTFRVATTDGGAAINTTGSQSGVHTLRRAPFGIPNGTDFTLPPFQGRVPVGRDSGQTEFVRMGKGGGAKTHTLVTSETPSHTHGVGTLTVPSGGTHTHEIGVDNVASAGSGKFTINVPANSAGDAGTISPGTFTDGAHTHSVSGSTGSAGSDGAHNNLQPYLSVNFIIKT